MGNSSGTKINITANRSLVDTLFQDELIATNFNQSGLLN
jgi:hypothetical protein